MHESGLFAFDQLRLVFYGPLRSSKSVIPPKKDGETCEITLKNTSISPTSWVGIPQSCTMDFGKPSFVEQQEIMGKTQWEAPHKTMGKKF